MAGYGKKVQRAKDAFNARGRALRGNIYEQKSLVSDYWSFENDSVSYGPQRSHVRIRNRYMLNPQGWHAACNGCSYSEDGKTPYFTYAGGTYTKGAKTNQAIADRLKPQAIKAELFGIAEAERKYAEWQGSTFTLPKSNSGKWNSNKPKIDSKTGQRIPKGEEVEVRPGVYNFKSGSTAKITGVNNFTNEGYLKMGKLVEDIEKAKSKEERDLIRKTYDDYNRTKYLDNFKITIDKKYGTNAPEIKTSPFNISEQLSNFKYMKEPNYEGYEQLTQKQKDSFRTELQDIMADRDVAFTQWSLGINERQTSKELDALNKKLDKKETELEKKLTNQKIAQIADEKGIELIAASNLLNSSRAYESWDPSAIINTTAITPSNARDAVINAEQTVKLLEIKKKDSVSRSQFDSAQKELAKAKALLKTAKSVEQNIKNTSELHKEVAKLRSEVDLKSNKLGGINQTQSSLIQDLNIAGRDEVYKKSYDKYKHMDYQTYSILMTKPTDNNANLESNINFQKQLRLSYDKEQEKLSDLTSALNLAKHLDRNRDKNFETEMSKINELAPGVIIEGEKINLGNDTFSEPMNRSKNKGVTTEGVIKQLENKIMSQREINKSIEAARAGVGAAILSGGDTSKRKQEIAQIYVDRINKPMEAKRYLEEKTGLDIIAGLETTNYTPREVTDMMLVNGLATGSNTQKGQNKFTGLSETKGTVLGYNKNGTPIYKNQSSYDDSIASYYQAWRNDSISVSKRDIIQEGTYDKSVQSDLRTKKQVLDKYGEWSNARSFVANSLDNWKNEIESYYGDTYTNKFGEQDKSNITRSLNYGGDKAVAINARASQESILFGESGGIRRDGDMGEIQDLGKLQKRLKGESEHWHKLKIKHSTSEENLIKKVDQLEKIHKSYQPEIDKKMSEISRLRDDNKWMEADTKFSAKLDASSQALYDAKYALYESQQKKKVASLTVDAIAKDLKDIQQERRSVQKSMLRSAGVDTSSSSRPVGRGRLWGYNQSKRFKRKTSANIKRTKSGNISLGGLVV